MIRIQEITPIKLSGRSSLLVTFNYNPRIVEIVKQFQPAVFNQKALTGEISIIYLARLLDALTFIDDIQLELLPDETSEISSEQLTEDGLKKFISQK